eukprot:352427-Chlamydomonas_euryale.AAC.6
MKPAGAPCDESCNVLALFTIMCTVHSHMLSRRLFRPNSPHPTPTICAPNLKRAEACAHPPTCNRPTATCISRFPTLPTFPARLAVTGEWLDAGDAGCVELRAAMRRLYFAAPAPVALSALAGHLSNVTPAVSGGASGGGARVSMPGAEFVIRLLAERFCPAAVDGADGAARAGPGRDVEADGSGADDVGSGGGGGSGGSGSGGSKARELGCRGGGLQEVVLCLALVRLPHASLPGYASTLVPCHRGTGAGVGTDVGTAGVAGAQPLVAAKTQQPPVLLDGADAVATLLVSMPDRAAAAPPLSTPSTPLAQVWHSYVLGQLLSALADPASVAEAAAARGGAKAADAGARAAAVPGAGRVDEVAGAVTAAAEQLLACVLERGCVRGAAEPLAAALICSLQPSGCGGGDVGIGDSGGGDGGACDGGGGGGGAATASDAEGSATAAAARRSIDAVMQRGGSSGGGGGTCGAAERLVRSLLRQLSAGCGYPTHLQPEAQYTWAVQPQACGGTSSSDASARGASIGGDVGRGAARLQALRCVRALLGRPSEWTADAAYLLCERLLLAATLPSPSLWLLLELLADEVPHLCGGDGPLPGSRASAAPGASAADEPAGGCGLESAAARLAQVWADGATLSRLPAERQGYLSHALCLVLCLLRRRAASSGAPTPLPASLLQGVSARLAASLVAPRRQGMRVGKIFAAALEPSSELFSDQEPLDWHPDELWDGALTPPPLTSGATQRPQHQPQWPGGAGGASCEARVRVSSLLPEGPDSDDDSDTFGDGDGDGDDGFDAFDVDEDASLDAWARAEPASLQLRALAAALRKADDAAAVVAALGRLEPVIRASPDELRVFAPELARALLHARPPEWADEDVAAAALGSAGGGTRSGGAAEGADPLAGGQVARLRCLSALAAACPGGAGGALLAELYSPHLDLHQRLLVLDAVAAAAWEMANPDKCVWAKCEEGV